jgi:hypothetical protein
MTLVEFVTRYLFTTSERNAYRRVSSAPSPKGLHSMFNFSGPVEAALPESQERHRLEVDLSARLRRELASGDWKVVGRPAHGGAFRELFPDEFSKAEFDLKANAAGVINQGTIISGWRDLNITRVLPTDPKWSGVLPRADVDRLVVQWIANLAEGLSKKVTRDDAWIQYTEDLKRSHGINPGAIAERKFRTLFSKHIPLSLRFTGRPPSKGDS